MIYLYLFGTCFHFIYVFMIIGNITIASDVVIGANAVVVHSINEPGITVAGNPAKKVSDTDSYYLNKE